ncbi:MAG: homogentisate 1,2-dioxygenase [Pseudomonadota bacterium]|nr:homogentisate 1,2-dioxygenase [Pseudomonadota bacterium]
MENNLSYQSGFGNYFETEAEKGALPIGQSMPQKPARGLYAEQLNGTSFTAVRSENQKVWFYRLRPSIALHNDFKIYEHRTLKSAPFDKIPTPPTQLRWNPLPIPSRPIDFIDSIITMAGNGVTNQSGCALHFYACNKSMENRYFYNSDGEMLLVPQQGDVKIKTECGVLDVTPYEICVIPRGIKFQVEIKGSARGYIGENYGAPFVLPNLGPIGANGLANARDFKIPGAHYEDKKGSFELLCKFQGHVWTSAIERSPLDVVAWHGNYVPYKYDLRNFQVINTVSYDHPDPSIFTVLTSPSYKPGTANIDFVIFPPRWMVAEHTFRPPYFHRNIMSEFMGLIHGEYDAKADGFLPGGASLHNCMQPHGPDKITYEAASLAELKPQKITNTMAFMFESYMVYHPTEIALNSEFRDKKYLDCWKGF